MCVFRVLFIAVILSGISVPAFPEYWQTFQAENNIQDIADAGDTVWMTLKGGGVFRWDSASGRHLRYDSSNGLKGTASGRIFKDSRNRIWAPNGGGVSCFENGKWKFYGAEDGLSIEGITSIAEDKLAVLWFGTYDNRVWNFDGKDWIQFSNRKNNFVQVINAMAIGNNGEVWAARSNGGTGYTAAITGGVIRFDGKYRSVFASQDSGLANNNVYSIARDGHGKIWAGTNNVLSVFNGKTWKTIEGTATGEQINDMAIDSDGVVCNI